MGTARIRRLAGALIALALTAGALSACQPHVGAAAFVGSTRISESTVGKYVNRTAAESTDQSTGQADNPKTDVLSALIVNDLLDRLLDQSPTGPPSPAVLEQARVDALTQIGATNLAALEAAAEPAGYTKAYAGIYLDENAKAGLLEKDLGDTDGSKLTKAINDLHVKVSVSPRYGAWDPAHLSLGVGPSLPSFLQLAATDSATGDGSSG